MTSILEHLAGCSIMRPCAHCRAIEYLRSKLPEGGYEQFVAILNDKISAVVSTSEVGTTLLNRTIAEVFTEEVVRQFGMKNNFTRIDGFLRDNFTYIGELVKITKWRGRLLGAHRHGRTNLGKVVINIVESVLALHGLRLGMQIPNWSAPPEKTVDK